PAATSERSCTGPPSTAMSPALSSFAASGPSGPGQPGRDRSGPARPDRSPSAPITTGKRVASESEAIRLSRPGGHLHRGGPALISPLAGTAGHRLDAVDAPRILGARRGRRRRL